MLASVEKSFLSSNWLWDCLNASLVLLIYGEKLKHLKYVKLLHSTVCSLWLLKGSFSYLHGFVSTYQFSFWTTQPLSIVFGQSYPIKVSCICSRIVLFFDYFTKWNEIRCVLQRFYSIFPINFWNLIHWGEEVYRRSILSSYSLLKWIIFLLPSRGSYGEN